MAVFYRLHPDAKTYMSAVGLVKHIVGINYQVDQNGGMMPYWVDWMQRDSNFNIPVELTKEIPSQEDVKAFLAQGGSAKDVSLLKWKAVQTCFESARQLPLPLGYFKSILLLISFLLILLSVSCTKFVTFKEDYFLDDRLTGDEFAGYYSLKYLDQNYFVFFLPDEANVFTVYVFDKASYAPSASTLMFKMVRVDDLYLAKVQDDASSIIFLLQLKPDKKGIDVKGGIIDFQYAFFREMIEGNYLTGIIEESSNDSADKLSNIQITANYPEFVEFVKNNKKLILKQFEEEKIRLTRLK